MALVHLLFWGVCTITSPPDSINVYWAELQGIHALLVTLEYLCTHRQMTSGGIAIGCDNQGTLKQAQQFQEQVSCADPHADLIQAITALCLWTKISLTFQYVPGHQDDLTERPLPTCLS